MDEVDVTIVGAGPAGLAAAAEAASRGCSVVVLDSGLESGGQLTKQIHKFFGSQAHGAGTRGIRIARSLLQDARDAGAKVLPEAEVYAIESGFRTSFVRSSWQPDDSAGQVRSVLQSHTSTESITSRQLILATGGAEIPLAFPGWTLPGVMGAGAAQTMANLWRVSPGRRVLTVGAGNVGLIVSYQLLQAGLTIAAVVEAAPSVSGYEVHAAKLRRAGVPILTSHTVVRADGDGRVSSATIARLQGSSQVVAGTEEVLDVDTVCVAVGLRPNMRLAILAGARIEHSRPLGGWVPVHDSAMETSIRGLRVAGDVAGIEEASIAMEEGRLAGIGAAAALGRDNSTDTELIQEILGRLGELRGLAAPSSSRTGSRGGRPERPLDSAGGTTPPETRLGRGPVAIIDCSQPIPCNPCESSCPLRAIRVGIPITNAPSLDYDRCVGCGQCIPSCPGLAIRLVDLSRPEECAKVSLPYEWLPRPRVGQTLAALDSNGQILCSCVVSSVVATEAADHTAVITLAVPRTHALKVRAILPPRGEHVRL